MQLDSLAKLPFNIDLLRVSDDVQKKLSPVTDTQIFGANNSFHPNGLFSTTIFGNIGTEFRNRTFGYIDLKVEIMHPLIYYAVITLKSFYADILSGKTLAIWDKSTKSFIKSSDEGSNTGYTFFYSHITELEFTETESDQRLFLIKLFKKAIKENTYLMRYFLVLPAGMRDYIIDPNGKPQEDEINGLYRKLITQSSIVDNILYAKNPSSYDNSRIGLQKVAYDIFEYIKLLLEGKHKLISGKWLSRRIFNSTRNVLSNPIEKVNNINDANRLGPNDSYIGLYQYLRALAPITLYNIKSKYIGDIFIENNNLCYLTNIKTLKREEIINTHIQKDFDLWTSADGLEKVIASFGNINIRHLPILLNKGKHYLGLIYNDGRYVKFLNDIDMVPDGFDRSKVTPITLAEFLYLSIYEMSGKYPGLIARYPVTGYGSIYPSYLKLITTPVSHTLEELDSEWMPTGKIATSFPIRGDDFFDTLGAHPSHFRSLGADIDGDTVSATGITSEEAINEIKQQLGKREYYISTEGKFYFSINTETIRTVLSYIT